eukprot:PhM_4_TR10420/c0_g1_i1/m.59005
MRFLYTIGANRNGQLGTEDGVAYAVTPTPVCFPDGTTSSENDIIDVCAGSYHTVAVTARGDVWGWGQNQFGQLSTHIQQTVVTTPMKIKTPVPVSRVGAGECHTLLLGTDGSVMVSGSRRREQQELRVVIPAGSDKYGRIVSVYSGINTSFAINSNGVVFGWGEGVPGMLLSSTPTQIHVGVDGTSIVKVCTSRTHCVALTTNGDVFAAGTGEHGELGLGRSTRTLQPWQPVRNAAGNVCDIATGQHHTVFVNNEGNVGTTGFNGNGRLGLGDSAQKEIFTPVTIPKLLEQDVVGVAAGSAFTLAWTYNGRILSWGSNGNGQLGVHPVGQPRDVPTLVEAPWKSSLRVVKCAAGETHAVVLLCDTPLDYPQSHFLGVTNTSISMYPAEGTADEVVVPEDAPVNLSFSHRMKKQSVVSNHSNLSDSSKNMSFAAAAPTYAAGADCGKARNVWSMPTICIGVGILGVAAFGVKCWMMRR